MVSGPNCAEPSDSETVVDTRIIKSPHAEVQTVVGLTVSEFVRAESVKYHSSNAIAFECLESGIKYTHKAVFDMSRGFAAGLIKLGIQRRDVVGIVLPNIPEYASVFLGIWDAGGICTTVNPAYGLDEMKWQLENSGTSYVVTTPVLVPMLQELKEKFVNSLKIIVVGKTTIPSCISFFDLIETDTEGVHFLSGSEFDTTEEIAMLPYSSGTTGLAKGVMLTHSNVCSNVVQLTQPGMLIMEKLVIGADGQNAERFVGLLPYFHAFGMILCFTGLRCGAHTVTLSKFEASTFLGIIRTHRPTVLHVVTPIIALLVKSPLVTKDDFKSVKAIVGGAAPIGPTLISALLEKAEKPLSFQEGYGMTEMSPCTHMLNPQIAVCKPKIGSIGFLAPSTMAKVISTDGSGRLLGPNERGELCVKGPQRMKGYLKNEEATRNTIDKEGWLHTGDIGYYDDDCCFYISDRLKELIKVKGEQVAPAELENTLREHPLVLDAAVIGIPFEGAGELPRAYIVRKSNTLTEDEVKDFVKSKLAHFKQLKGGVQFVESIPKAPSGKILRRVLRQEYAELLLLAKDIEITRL